MGSDERNQTGNKMFSTTTKTLPRIKIEDNLPPAFGKSRHAQENHDKLLGYLQERLASDAANREERIRRYASIDKLVSTWQQLTAEDSERKDKQEKTGVPQAIAMNLPLIHTHLDDMVSFFAGVYAPAAGSFFSTPEPASQDKGKALVDKLNTDARRFKYYKNLCAGIRSLLKYNIGGYALSWFSADGDLDSASDDDLAKGGNNVVAVDSYNLSWDQSISDPADVRKHAEWGAMFENWNRKMLLDRYFADDFANLARVLGTDNQNGLGQNGNAANHYRSPPNQAGIAWTDAKTNKSARTVDWAAYNASLSSEKAIPIEGHEIVQMFCWIQPQDFKFVDDNGAAYQDQRLQLWRFYILDDKAVVYARPHEATGAEDAESLIQHEGEIPIYLGFLNQDDMGAAQRSIAELLGPFQSFASFLLNSHVAGVRASVYGVQVYDPQGIDMSQIPEGSTAARVPTKAPGRDVRSIVQKMDGEVDTGNTMQNLQIILSLVKEFFPAQALPSQIAGMDRAVTSQVAAVLQGVNRRLHMMVRVVDDDILSPLRFAQYKNIVKHKAADVAGILDHEAVKILGSGLAQLNREVAEQAMRQLLFAVIQNPAAAQELDILAMMNYWSGLLSMETDVNSFKKQAPTQQPPDAPNPNAPPMPDQAVA